MGDGKWIVEIIATNRDDGKAQTVGEISVGAWSKAMLTGFRLEDMRESDVFENFANVTMWGDSPVAKGDIIGFTIVYFDGEETVTDSEQTYTFASKHAREEN